MSFKTYRNLEVWQKAMDLVVVCYEMTKGFPKSETYGLAAQLSRQISLKGERDDTRKSFFNIWE